MSLAVTSADFRVKRAEPSPNFGTPIDYLEYEFGSMERFWEYHCALGKIVSAYERTKSQSERWSIIRQYYEFIQSEIDDSPIHRWAIDPYQISFDRDYSPIEKAAWDALRIYSVPMYPQYPILNYFADFAHPKLKLILELDGKQWHNAEKDAKRDARIVERGWKVYRVTGAECYRILPEPWELREDELSDDEWVQKTRDWFTRTVDGVIYSLKMRYFRDEDWMDSIYADFIDESLEMHQSSGVAA